MKNLKELQAQANEANEAMMHNTSFTVEYQRRGINIDGDFVSNSYILKESGDIEAHGNSVEIIEKMNEMVDRMTTKM